MLNRLERRGGLGNGVERGRLVRMLRGWEDCSLVALCRGDRARQGMGIWRLFVWWMTPWWSVVGEMRECADSREKPRRSARQTEEEQDEEVDDPTQRYRMLFRMLFRMLRIKGSNKKHQLYHARGSLVLPFLQSRAVYRDSG